MEQSLLKYLRILIPGMYIMSSIYPIYIDSFSEIIGVNTIDFSYFCLISLFFGSLYYLTGIQGVASKLGFSYINKNIEKRLVSIRSPQLTNLEVAKVKNKQKLLNVFYSIVDSDGSLTKKSANVFFNGIFVTSTADASIIYLFAFLMYKTFLNEVSSAGKFSCLFGIISILSFLMHIVSVYRHFKLSQKQLDYINYHKKNDVNLRINELL